MLWVFCLCAVILVNASSSSSSSSSSNSSEDERETTEIGETGEAAVVTLPRETRHRSSTEAAQLMPLSPRKVSTHLEKSPTSVTLSTFTPPSPEEMVKALLPYQRSFGRFVLARALSNNCLNCRTLTSPRVSPVILQLDVIDRLLATQFALKPAPKVLMTGHLDLLKSHCRKLALELGPLNPKARNCALRFNELERFVSLLTKYNIDTSVYRGRQQVNFCSHFIPAVKKLNTLLLSSFTEFSMLIEEDAGSQPKKLALYPQLEPIKNELKEFEETIDAVDFDLAFYCTGDAISNSSLSVITDSLNRFLHLAFI